MQRANRSSPIERSLDILTTILRLPNVIHSIFKRIFSIKSPSSSPSSTRNRRTKSTVISVGSLSVGVHVPMSVHVRLSAFPCRSYGEHSSSNSALGCDAQRIRSSNDTVACPSTTMTMIVVICRLSASVTFACHRKND